MKKIITIFMAALMPALFAAPAVAALSSFYVGAKLGTDHIGLDGLSDSPVASGLFGGFKINPNWAVEAGYLDLNGDPSGRDNFTASDISAVGFYPTDDQFSWFGKIGIANYDTEGFSLSLSGKTITFELGGQLDIGKSGGVRFSYDYHNYKSTSTSEKVNSSLFCISGIFKF
jgi:hypothetical protein